MHLTRYIATILLSIFCLGAARAQSPVLMRGKVLYERRMNQHSALDNETSEGEENTWVQEMRKNFPKFVTNNYELQFGDGRTVYKQLEETVPQKYLWSSKPSEADVVVQVPQAQTMTVQRDVFEKTYLIQDSVRPLQWRITNETRTIAGFECRKAVTRICDSVVVVAFFCQEIPYASGPEAMGGLPGLILGLAVPRLHTTWFATTVQLMNEGEQQLYPKQKGTKATWKKVEAELGKAVADWGRGGKQTLWRTLL